MYGCILDQSGALLVHRHMPTDPETFLPAGAPYRPGMVGAVECLCPWDWLAALGADAGSPGVLGPALSRKAIQSGKAQQDQLAAQKIAALLRGAMRPQADVSPAQRRATRAWRRRRMPLAHKRAALLAHGQHTHSPSPLPAIGTQIASTANRAGVAERCAEAAVHPRSAVDLALITSYEARLRDVARTIVTTATHPDAPTRSRRPTVPGLGQSLSRVRLSAIPDGNRGPRGQALGSSCRLVYGARDSAGKRDGTSGAQRGHAHRKGALSAAAVLCLRDHPAAPSDLARLAPKHATGHALPILAPTLARAVSSMRQRPGAGAQEKCCQR